jgi:hypothetical protein
LDQVAAEISEVKRAVEHLTSVVETCPAFAAEKSNQQNGWRIGYLFFQNAKRSQPAAALTLLGSRAL